MARRQSLQRGSDRLIGSHAAGDNQRGCAIRDLYRSLCPVQQAIDNRLLKRSGDIFLAVDARIARAQHSTFQTGKGKMRFPRPKQWSGQRTALG